MISVLTMMKIMSTVLMREESLMSWQRKALPMQMAMNRVIRASFRK